MMIKHSNCERCGKENKIFTCSFFNTEMICISCKEEEQQHKHYELAKQKELSEVKKGNYNYEGIYYGLSWEEIQNK